MDCFNYNCPFYNKTSSRCECITCPNRCEAYTTTYASNHTLCEEIVSVRSNYCPYYGAKMDEKED